jgi:hypothetical protein
MHGHRSFLIIGDNISADMESITRKGYEVCKYECTIKKDEPKTRLYCECFDVTIPGDIPRELVLWVKDPSNYTEGMIINLDKDNKLNKKIEFKNGFCMEMKTILEPKSDIPLYTKMSIRAESLSMDGMVVTEWK